MYFKYYIYMIDKMSSRSNYNYIDKTLCTKNPSFDYIKEANVVKIKERIWGLVYLACNNGNADIVQSMMHYIVDDTINDLSVEGWSMLGLACYCGYDDIINLLLTHPNINVNADSRFDTNHASNCLQLACQKNHVGIVNTLLSHPHINANKKAFYPGEYATHDGKSEISQTAHRHYLYQSKGDLGDPDVPIVQPHISFNTHNQHIIQDENNDENIDDDENYASTDEYDSEDIIDDVDNDGDGYGDVDDVIDYRNRHSKVVNKSKFKDREANTPLDIAVMHGSLESAQLLLKSDKVDVKTIYDINGNTILDHIISYVYRSKDITIKLIDCLLDRQDLRLDINDEYFLRPILLCLIHDNHDISKYLIQRIVNVNPKINVNVSCEILVRISIEQQLLKKQFNGLFEYVINLVSHNLNNKNKNHDTLLHIACDNLLNSGSTSVMCIAYNDIVKHITLIDNLNVNEYNRKGLAPLHTAIWKGSVEAVKYLLNRVDINPNIMSLLSNDSQYTFTPLHIACTIGNVEMIELLLVSKPGIDVNALDNHGCSPLIKLCKSINEEYVTKCIKVILSLRPDINLNIQFVNVNNNNDRRKRTLLDLVCVKGYFEVVKYLLAFGATTSKDLKNINSDDDNYSDIGHNASIDPHVGYNLVKQHINDPYLFISHKAEIDPISKVFTTIVLLCDGYYRLKQSSSFYNIVCKLPMDLQMIMCHRLFRSTKQNITGKLVTEQVKLLLA